MTLLRTESFEWAIQNGNAAKMLFTSSSIGIVTGRTGRGFHMASYSSKLSGSGALNASESHATLIFGWFWKMPGSHTNLSTFTVSNSANSDQGIRMVRDANAGGIVTFYRWNPTSGLHDIVLFTTTLTGSKYVEVKVTWHGSAGLVEMRVDEEVVGSFSGQTIPTGFATTVLNRYTFDLYGDSTAGQYAVVDDMYLCNGAGSSLNNYLGGVKIVGLVVNGNGEFSEWVGSDGNSTDNYLLNDEPAGDGANDSDYVQSSTDGVRDTYSYANLTDYLGVAADSPVRAVVVYSSARKMDAGARDLSHVARQSGSELETVSSGYDGLGLSATEFRWMHSVFTAKPGGGAWTVADVDAAEFGIKPT